MLETATALCFHSGHLCIVAPFTFEQCLQFEVDQSHGKEGCSVSNAARPFPTSIQTQTERNPSYCHRFLVIGHHDGQVWMSSSSESIGKINFAVLSALILSFSLRLRFSVVLSIMTMAELSTNFKTVRKSP
jgi:hypothetical protein